MNLYHMELPFLSKVYLSPGVSTPQYEELYLMILMYYLLHIRSLILVLVLHPSFRSYPSMKVVTF
jgi:hypothetical protein